MTLGSFLFAAAVVPQLFRGPACAQRAAPSMNLRLSKSSGGFADVEKDLLGKIGLGDDGLEEPAPIPAPPAAPAPPPAPAPRSGTMPWGKWSNGDDSIELEIALPDGTRARDLVCEVNAEGVLLVQVGSAKLLSGKLALVVDREELCWAMEGELLCIDVPLRSITHEGQLGKATTCIFETLEISGAAITESGLTR